MSDNQNVPKKDEKADKELDDLLDSALQDMTKNNKQDVPKEGENLTNDIQEFGDGMPQNMWTEEFIKEAAAQFESNMAAILGSVSGVSEDQITQEQIAQTFSKMAEAAAMVMRPQPEGAEEEGANGATEVPTIGQENINDMTAAIAQTLQGLSSGADNLQTPFNDQDLANMFSNFNLDGSGGQDPSANMFLPFMQGMMQSLLSKEVLYPSLKELVDKYPAWLEANKNKIDNSEFEKYKSQQELMLKVCAELESEQETDSEEVKHERFTKVLTMMQQMQDLGQPPTELVGDIQMATPGLPMMPPAAVNANPADQQCSVM